MSLKISYILLALFIPFVVKAQYSYQWTRFFGSDSLIEATSIGITKAGNIIVAGTIQGNGIHTLIQKVTPQGLILWNKSISNHTTTIPSKIIVLPDSSIVVVGTMRDWDEREENTWLAKLDTSGALLWERTFPQFGQSQATDIKQTPDRGFIITANQFIPQDNAFDWLVIKTDSLGMVKWYRSSGTPYDDNLNAVAVLPNNTYAVAGYTTVNKGALKIMAVSVYDSLGREIAYNDFKSLGFSEAMNVTATFDTNIVLTGFAVDSLYKQDIVVMKLSRYTDSIWQKVIHLPFRQIPFSTIEAFDHTYVIGYNLVTSEFPYSDIGILQLDTAGNTIFSRLLRRSTSDFVAQLIELKDNSLALLATNFIIGRGWVVSLTRWKSILTSDLLFLFPRKNIIATTMNVINVKACIKSYMTPQQEVVVVNNQVVDTIKNFTLTQNRHCSFAFDTDVKLHFGLNVIKFETTDYKGYKFIRKRVIIYIPLPNKTW